MWGTVFLNQLFFEKNIPIFILLLYNATSYFFLYSIWYFDHIVLYYIILYYLILFCLLHYNQFKYHMLVLLTFFCIFFWSTVSIDHWKFYLNIYVIIILFFRISYVQRVSTGSIQKMCLEWNILFSNICLFFYKIRWQEKRILSWSIRWEKR